MNIACPVCGYLGLREPPHYHDGGASNEICPSCGFHFGYDDDSARVRYSEWRQCWIIKGMPWFSKGRPKPDDFEPLKQLEQVPRAKLAETRCPACGFVAAIGEPTDPCPSCGYVSSSEKEPIEWRRVWLSNKMEWFSKNSPPPPDWNPREQLNELIYS